METKKLMNLASSDSEFIGPEPAVGISSTITRSFIWGQVKNKHNKDWRDSIRFRQSKIYLDGTSSKLTESLKTKHECW